MSRVAIVRTERMLDEMPGDVSDDVSDKMRDEAPPPGPAVTWTLTGLLRTGGTAALVIALAQFLLIGVHVDNDLQRFGLLLSQTGLFTGCAFMLQRFLQDTRSARLLLGVALVSVVAGFAVLGAMLYATFPLDGGPVPVDGSGSWPDASSSVDGLATFTQWQAGSAIETLIAAAVATLVLLPTARFGFAVLARDSAGRLTTLTALASLALLVPVRDPLLTGLIAAVTLLAVAAAQRGMADRDPTLTTAEGRFARAIPFLPAGVVIARTVLLYEVDAGLVLPLALAAWFVMRNALMAPSRSARFQDAGYAVGVIVIAVAAVSLLVCLEPLLDTASIALMTLVTCLGAFELRRHVATTPTVRRFDTAALLLAALLLSSITVVSSALRFPEIWVILATLPLIGFAAATRRPVIAVLLTCLMGWQSLMVVEHLLALLTGHGWQSLVGVGLVAIVSAGWIERRRSRVLDDSAVREACR